MPSLASSMQRDLAQPTRHGLILCGCAVLPRPALSIAGAVGSFEREAHFCCSISLVCARFVA